MSYICLIMSPMNAVVFGQIKKISKRPRFAGLIDHNRDLTIKLSTGHQLHISSSDRGRDDVLLGQWRFFTVDSHNNTFYAESRVMEESDVKEISLAFENMKNATHKVVTSLEGLGEIDRGIVLRTAGMAITGFTAITSTITAIGSLFAWEPTTLAVSTGTAAVTGALTYIQYEGLSKAMQKRVDILSEFNKNQRNYSRLVMKYIPLGGAKLRVLNPEVGSIVTTLSKAFSEITTETFFKNEYAIA